MAKVISASFMAALAAGAATPADADAAAALTEDVTATPPAKAEDEAGATPPAAAGDPAKPAEPAAAATPAATAATTTEDASLVAHLRTDLKDSRTEVAALNQKLGQATADLKAANEKSEKANLLIPKLEALVRNSANVMSIALGNKAVGLDNLSGEQLIEFHGQLATTMKTHFKIGGVAHTSAVEAEPRGDLANDASPTRIAGARSSTIGAK